MNFPEQALSGPVARWMEGQGFVVYAEICAYAPISHGVIDLVGLRDDGRLIAVELKKHLSRDVIRQLLPARMFTNLCYAAISTMTPNNLSLAMRQKIGVLSVRSEKVDVLLHPSSEDYSIERYRSKVLKILAHSEPGRDAGLPCVKGIGPARKVFRAVKEFRRAHPLASWRVIFERIPHHYPSVSSMRSAMRLVENEEKLNRPATLG